MKKRKLRPFVLPTVYVIGVTILFITIITIGSKISKSYKEDNKTVTKIIKKDTTPVISTEDEKVKPSKPYTSQNVEISKYFYNKDSDDARKESSIIYYENTYMQNTGVLYASDEEFEVISSLPGKVTSVKDDNILGKVVYVEYNTNLTIAYYSLSETNLKIGDQIEQDSIIGKSGTNKLETEKKYSLLVEVYQNGSLIDPLDFYEKDINELIKND